MESAQALIAPARRIVRDTLRRYAPTLACRLGSFRLTEDRRLLETVILPYLAQDRAVRRLLFVGCEWYTKPYERLFANKEYWTLDIGPDKRRYGADCHIVDGLRNLERHVPAAHFDAIICNGVFMRTAIETREEAEPSFAACCASLRPGGWFLLGWNDTPLLRPYSPSESDELAKLERTVFPPLRSSEIATATSYRHTYTFFKKPRAPFSAERR